MDFRLLNAVSDPNDKESLQISLELSLLSASDLRKQIAILRETIQPNGQLASFGLTVRFLGITKTTVSEHYCIYLGERAHRPGPPGHPRKLTRPMEEAITVKATECYETHVACIYSRLADFLFDVFGLILNNPLVRLTVERSPLIKAVLAHRMEQDRVACPFTDITTPSLDAQAKTGACILETGHPSWVEMLAFPSVLLDLDEDQTPYQFLLEASLESDERWTWPLQETLEQEFSGGTDDVVGQWHTWK
jgi:hypothetical protein